MWSLRIDPNGPSRPAVGLSGMLHGGNSHQRRGRDGRRGAAVDRWTLPRRTHSSPLTRSRSATSTATASDRRRPQP
jgi:hypothetical protein